MSSPAPLDPRVAQLIQGLQLTPHPEGGYFREVYRSRATITPGDGRPPRTALTTIYYLLPAGSHSRWHRVRSDEAWHFLEGGLLELLLAPPDCAYVERVRLGAPLAPGSPVHVVPPGWWQAARPLGGYSLVGCTVAPGFETEDFGFLADDEPALAALGRLSPALARLA